ncbi:tRNA pseudouridine(13) synthase TruD [Streptomyces roseus]|uniref:tRNA pseudouridine(13) synthase TruD n=1 Tax=Streptomyces roseus TaxID=66430 RepID=UPI00381497A8
MKEIPEDFLVEECLALPLGGGAGAAFQYLRLTKRGFTTFRAIEEVAWAAEVSVDKVAYAGLKDEDAVTRQYVAVPGGIAGPALDRFNKRFSREGNYMSLSPLGYGTVALRLGGLAGNCFRLVLRRVDPAVVERLAERRHNLYFFNYFDTQRFGVPDGPKVAHWIGQALLRGDYDGALKLLVEGKSDEGRRAEGWTGDAQAFFGRLDQRVTSLYLNAASAHDFNLQLAGEVDRCSDSDSYSEVRDGLPFRFATAQTALQVALRATDLPYEKYRAGTGGMRRTFSRRPTVLQAQVEAGPAGPDGLHPGFSQCAVAFFLSPGAYATMAVSQLLARLAAGLPPGAGAA